MPLISKPRIIDYHNEHYIHHQVGCEFTACLGTSHRGLLSIQDYHAILFHGRDMDNNPKVCITVYSASFSGIIIDFRFLPADLWNSGTSTFSSSHQSMIILTTEGFLTSSIGQ